MPRRFAASPHVSESATTRRTCQSLTSAILSKRVGRLSSGMRSPRLRIRSHLIEKHRQPEPCLAELEPRRVRIAAVLHIARDALRVFERLYAKRRHIKTTRLGRPRGQGLWALELHQYTTIVPRVRSRRPVASIISASI